MTYPRPDRSNHTPQFTKTSERPYVDIGFAEGEMTDGRPYRAECWAEDGVTVLTFFFSSDGLEELSAEELKDLLVREGLVVFAYPERRFAGVGCLVDPSGNQLYSVNVIVADEDTVYAESEVLLSRYPGQC